MALPRKILRSVSLFFPLGTGNDFARSIGLPANIDECIELIAQGRTKAIDLVRVTSDQVRYFVNVSTGGFSGLVDEKLTPEIKKSWGPLAYLRGAAAALPELRAYKTKIIFDETEEMEIALHNVIIGNGRYVAGGIPVTPEALVERRARRRCSDSGKAENANWPFWSRRSC